MQILLTGTGTPYIEVDDNTKFVFSSSTAGPEGYKFMVVSHKKTSTVCISGAKAKKKRYMKKNEDRSFTVRLKDFRRDNERAFPKGVVSPITLNVVKKLILDEVEGDILPYHKIETLNDNLVRKFDDPTETVDDDPTADESFDDVVTVRPAKAKKKTQLRLKAKTKIKSPIRLKKKK